MRGSALGIRKTASGLIPRSHPGSQMAGQGELTGKKEGECGGNKKYPVRDRCYYPSGYLSTAQETAGNGHSGRHSIASRPVE